MKHISLFEDFQDKKFNEIDSICRKFSITNWTLNEDGTVDVDGGVNLSHKRLKKLPLNFGKVSHGFACAGNNLTTLEGAPKEIGQDFDCSNNKLISLEGGPIRVGRNFHCYSNKLITLEGAPMEVNGHFNCYSNELTSLKGGPIKVGLGFFCRNNKLTTLEGAPKEVGGDFNCSNNKLISLEGAPKEVGGDFNCIYNPIWEVYSLFPDYKSFVDSMDYGYLRGTTIDKRRFREALEEVKRKVPKSITGYKYI
jgi:hypothetical protein